MIETLIMVKELVPPISQGSSVTSNRLDIIILEDLVNQYFQASLAPSTHKTYTSAMYTQIPLGISDPLQVTQSTYVMMSLTQPITGFLIHRSSRYFIVHDQIPPP